MATMLEQIHTLVEHLSPDDQKQALALIDELASIHDENLPKSKLPPGTHGEALLRVSLPLEHVEAMERAIAEPCERIEPDEC